MAYKIKRNYQHQEYENFKANCRKHPEKCSYYNEAKRLMYHYPQVSHTEGNPIWHGDKLARVYKVRRDGVEVQYILERDKGIFGKLSKPTFIPEKRYEKEVKPYFAEFNF